MVIIYRSYNYNAYIDYLQVSHLVRCGSWICPSIRRAIAIVAISPRRISYITITLLLLNVQKADVHTGKFYGSAISERGGSTSDAHRKFVILNRDRPRFRIAVVGLRVRFVACGFRYCSTNTISLSLSLRFVGMYLTIWNFVSAVCPASSSRATTRGKFLVVISIAISAGVLVNTSWRHKAARASYRCERAELQSQHLDFLKCLRA